MEGDGLLLSMLMNNSKVKQPKQDDHIQDNMVRNLRNMFRSLEQHILNNPTVQSNFTEYLTFLHERIKSSTDEFRK